METKQIENIEPTVKPKNKRLEGGGRKPLDLQLEKHLNGFLTGGPVDCTSQGNLLWPRQNIFVKVHVMKVRNFFLWRAMGGPTISCVIMVFHYVIKQQQHNKILNG